MPVPRTTVTVGGLAGMAAAFDALGDALGREAQKGLNEVATNAVKRLSDVVDREVDGGAVAFTKVALTGRSSMSMRRGRYADGDDEAESDVHVNPLQSRYLKYLLGEEEVRRAGDTGVAKEWNFIPVADAFPYLDEQGADPEYGQNLKRGTLAKLFRRAEAQKRKVAEARARGRAPRLTGPLRFGRLFFGEVGGTMGLYERPVGRAVSLKLLILAQKRSEYRAPSGYLLPGWNRSVSDAMATYPARMRRRLAEETARIAASSGASGGGGGGGPP